MFRSRSSRSALALVVVLAASAATLTGCSDAPAPPDDIVLVVGATEGSPALTPSALAAPLSALDAEGDHLVAVLADGVPRAVVDVTVPKLPGNGADRDAMLADLRQQVQTAVVALRSAEPEVDLTGAIALGSQAFRPQRAHSMYVYSSGLQTTGSLSLLDGRLYAEPSDLVAHVRQSGDLADLSGVRVRMPLGVVTAPQPAMTQEARVALKGIWSAYFRASGVTDVDLTPTDLQARSITGDLATVTPVPIERPTAAAASGCRQTLGTASIGFAAGSAELADPAGTRQLIAHAVEALAPCPGDYRVEASASSEGPTSANQELSLARATAIADVLKARLAELGTSDEVSTVGWGESWPCRVPDVDASGHLILSAAIANRVVVVGKGAAGC